LRNVPKDVLECVQMAQQEVDRLWAELQQVEQDIKDREKRLEAATTERDSAINAIIQKGIDRLVQKERDVRQQLSTLQALLATPPSEIPCCSPMLTGAMTQDSQLLGVSRKLLGMSLVPKLCHPVLRASVCSRS
jgi:hypothetical protein